jgi:Protein of unknown function (DUF1569)
MALPNIFDAEITQTLIERIQKLTPTTQAVWGKMNVAQMLAHCNVAYEITYDNIHPKPNFLMKWMLKTFLKKIVVGEKPFAKNSRTAPVFLMVSEKDFSKEKERLIQYSIKTNQLGAAHFEGKENLSFGALTATEWNNLFYKHLDHHLTQFGV